MLFLPGLLERTVRRGRLELIGPDGRSWHMGDGTGPDLALRVRDRTIDWRLPMAPELAAAEALIEGGLEVERGTLPEVVELYFRNRDRLDAMPLPQLRDRLMRAMRWAVQRNSRHGARANAAHHYDLGNDFYRLWLDEDMQYSCAYFERGDETLEEAQAAKKRHIAAKLRLRPGQRVLDIGCGWGGMALYMARVADVEVTGITLAERQLELARARAEEAGLSDRVRFELMDYRDVTGRFDRIVSIGMAEHVGAPNLGRYFSDVHDRLEDDGIALTHAIVSRDPPCGPDPFLDKYIFPGGYTPALSEAFGAIEEAGLWPLDTEVWRLHYARTLACWRERFEAVRGRIEAEFGTPFVRMWLIYLAACEAAFTLGPSCVAQLQLGRERDAVPITRDYLAREKATLLRAEGRAPASELGEAERKRKAS